MKEYYYKVIGMDSYVLGYTSRKETYLKESIKEGWKESQLKFIKLTKTMDKIKVKNVRYFETRRGLGYEVKTNCGTIWNDGNGGGTYTDSDWGGRDDLSEFDLERLIDEYELLTKTK